ncbi:MAG: hypothetical protein C0616_13565 [Desulfuromonas sp.]|nr:MAG: hypothetical protein C0616_13565 [Desulfuromonas sp.]
MSSKKPSLLFISPMVPNPDGGGAAQRGFHFLRLLQERYAIDLLVTGDSCGIPTATTDLVERVVSLQSSRLFDLRYMCSMIQAALGVKGLLPYPTTPEGWFQVTPRRLRIARAKTRGKHYRVIHAFRLSSAPFALNCNSGESVCRLQLDLDESESRVLAQVAHLQRANDEPAMGTRSLAASSFLAQQEADYLPRFDRIFVSSELEKNILFDQFGAQKIHIAPNVVPARESPHPSPQSRQTYRLLFVGSFGYYPNQDALRFFFSDIAPHIRKRIDFRLTCVGYGLEGDFLAWLHAQQGVIVAGKVADLAPWYLSADAAIVPLRAGGGTRIKILEAFAFHCPVVSTPQGAEGLDVVDGNELLLAKSAASFAKQCLRVLTDTELRQHLADNANRLLRQDYSMESLKRAIYD